MDTDCGSAGTARRSATSFAFGRRGGAFGRTKQRNVDPAGRLRFAGGSGGRPVRGDSGSSNRRQSVRERRGITRSHGGAERDKSTGRLAAGNSMAAGA